MERKVILLIKADNLRIFRNIRHVSKIHSIWIGAKPWPLTCQYLKNLRFSKINVSRTQTIMQTNRLTDGRTASSPPPPPQKNIYIISDCLPVIFFTSLTSAYRLWTISDRLDRGLVVTWLFHFLNPNCN